MDQDGKKQVYFGYPKAVKGPDVPYSKKEDSNPVFSGIPLVLGGWLYVTFSLSISTSSCLLLADK
jgi:hypothetical protein